MSDEKVESAKEMLYSRLNLGSFSTTVILSKRDEVASEELHASISKIYSGPAETWEIELRETDFEAGMAAVNSATSRASIELKALNYAMAGTTKAKRTRRKNMLRTAPKVEIAPGFKLHRWLSTVCPRKFKENVLDELLATGTVMYQEALAQGDFAAATRIRWAMRFWMVKSVLGGFITGAFSLLGQFRQKSE